MFYYIFCKYNKTSRRFNLKLLILITKNENGYLRMLFKRNSHRFFKLLSLLILSIFISSSVFNFAFLHTHKLPNGKIVCHSHHTDNENQQSENKSGSHEHNNLEYLYYYIVTVFNNFLLFFVVFISGIKILRIFKQHQIFSPLHKFIIIQRPLRAPPIFSV